MEWKVGELARLTGLTVRTLHHYERVGLLEPSARTTGGHRLYAEADVSRLYRIVALRELGLPLDAVRTVLDGEFSLGDLLREHLAQVERQVEALRALRDRLAMLVSRDEKLHTPADLLALMEEANTVDEKMRTYFSEEQLQALNARQEALGSETISAVEAEWPELIAKVQAEMDAGTDPAEPRVQALAARWMELVEAFHGGDPELRDSLYRMHTENSEQSEPEFCGPSAEIMEYVQRSTESVTR